MVSRYAKLARAHRVRRFVEVWRTEGPRAATDAVIRHVRLARHGHVPSVVEAAAADAAPTRYALSPIWTDLARNGAFHTAAPAVVNRRRRVAMIGDLNLPQCRKYRVEQLDEIWAKADVGYGFAHYEDVPRCIDLLQSATHLILYRLGQSSLAEMYLYEARRLRLPVLYDIDDPLFSFAAYATYGNCDALPDDLRAHLIAQAPGYLAVMNQCDALALSTPGLVDEARAHSARPAFLRRNFADRATLDAGRRAAGRRTRSGFTVAFASGSMGHEADLLSVADEIAEFLQGADDRSLLILGRFDLDRLPEAIRDRTRLAPFGEYTSYLSALGGADCTLLPLTDDAFNRCKSAVRVIDAAAVGVPSLVGGVGDGSAMVRDGETGLVVAPGEGGWREALERLAAAPGTAAQLGRAARRDLETRWAASTELPVVAPELVAEITG